MHDELRARLDRIARTPVLLVASDLDGVLAAIVSDPSAAVIDREALRALERLSALPNTYVAIVSGRMHSDLRDRVPSNASITLIGEHGSTNGVMDEVIVDSAREQLDRLARQLDSIASTHEGAWVERKTTAVAIHYRSVAVERHDELLESISRAATEATAPRVYHGKCVVECSFARSGKGAALDRMRREYGAQGVVFLGDDATDEDAFGMLSARDLAIKVGPEHSLAPHRVESIADVRNILSQLADARAGFANSADVVPIDQYSLLSDQRTIALVDTRGRIGFLCLPRIDSSAMFSELLGPGAGHFSISQPSGERPIAVEYVGDSLVLRTRWGGFDVYDYLDAAQGRAFQRPGRTDLVRAIEGHGRVRIEFAPRRDFGRVATRIARATDGLVVEGGVDPLVLRAPGVAFEIIDDGPHHTAIAEIELGDDPVVLELRHGTGNLSPAQLPESRRREANRRFWEAWAASLHVPPLARAETIRSALVLKALTYGPTGAIAAAATTSLPEALDGDRNWDYRFCWPRDAAIAAHSLAMLGSHGPGLKLLDWLLGLHEDRKHDAPLAPVYTVSGGHLGPEAEIRHLPGYRGCAPVRVSNAAAGQVQLDVFGPIADLVAELARTAAPLSTEHLELLRRMVNTVAARWREPDHGIWEIRLPQRHHVHSKVMCWVTVDRAIRVARYLGREDRSWAKLRDTILADILENGVTDGAFGTAYGDRSADAAALWTGLSGALPPDDPRFLATIERVTCDLESHGSIYRYRFDDGLEGREGAFHICTTWWIEALAISGRVDRATRAFDQYLRRIGPTGLLSEQYDPLTRIPLGNTPQAYSHAGLIRLAARLDDLSPRSSS